MLKVLMISHIDFITIASLIEMCTLLKYGKRYIDMMIMNISRLRHIVFIRVCSVRVKYDHK